MYNVPSKLDETHKLELLRHSKNFNKKRITQMAVVADYNLLILLTGSTLSISNCLFLIKLRSPNFVTK